MHRLDRTTRAQERWREQGAGMTCGSRGRIHRTAAALPRDHHHDKPGSENVITNKSNIQISSIYICIKKQKKLNERFCASDAFQMAVVVDILSNNNIVNR